MIDMTFGLISFLIALAAFVYGASGLFRKKKPLYFRILACAAGCLALQRLSHVVNLWCGVFATGGIGMLGIFGCNFFLLSANYGALDKIVDDGRDSKKARSVAFVAPVIMAALTVIAFLAWKDRDTFCAVMWLVILLPSLPASYFSLKHVLLPMDPFGFLKTTRPCDTAALVFYAVTAAYGICSLTAGSAVSGVLSVLMSMSVLCLTLYAVKGASKWEI